jgi:hypothetical protein
MLTAWLYKPVSSIDLVVGVKVAPGGIWDDSIMLTQRRMRKVRCMGLAAFTGDHSYYWEWKAGIDQDGRAVCSEAWKKIYRVMPWGERVFVGHTD